MEEKRTIHFGEVLLRGAKERARFFSSDELDSITQALDRLYEAYLTGKINERLDWVLMKALPAKLREQIGDYYHRRGEIRAKRAQVLRAKARRIQQEG